MPPTGRIARIEQGGNDVSQLRISICGPVAQCFCADERHADARSRADVLRRFGLLYGPGRLRAKLALHTGYRMTDGSQEPPESSARPWRYYVTRAARNISKWRPASFYLLLAILIVTVLGLGIIRVRDDPQQFAIYLILLFVFFFVVIARAIMDCMEIWRRSFSEHQRLYKDTLGEDEFVGKLSRSVDHHHESR
jgi:hypothetical protein